MGRVVMGAIRRSGEGCHHVKTGFPRLPFGQSCLRDVIVEYFHDNGPQDSIEFLLVIP